MIGLFPITHYEVYFKYWYIKLNLDCNYTFQIDVATNGIPISAKSIEKV